MRSKGAFPNLSKPIYQSSQGAAALKQEQPKPPTRSLQHAWRCQSDRGGL